MQQLIRFPWIIIRLPLWKFHGVNRIYDIEAIKNIRAKRISYSQSNRQRSKQSKRNNIWSAKTVWDKMGRSLNPWPKSSNIELRLFPCIPRLMKLSNRIDFRSVRTDMVNQHSCRNLKFKLFISVKENYNSERIFRVCKGSSRFPWPDGLVG